MPTIRARHIGGGRRFPHLDPAGIGRDGEDLSWQRRAACRRVDPDLFFPEPGEDGFDERLAAAKQVCATCPVATACRAHARDRFERHGIWGGEAARHRPYRPRGQGTAPRRERDAEIVRLTRAGLTADHIARRLDCHRRTVVRALGRHRDQATRAA